MEKTRGNDLEAKAVEERTNIIFSLKYFFSRTCVYTYAKLLWGTVSGHCWGTVGALLGHCWGTVPS